jgi:hypothetical protein
MTTGLALGILALFFVVNLTGPFALYYALQDYHGHAACLAFISLVLGLHWYVNILTPPRYLGLFSAAFGAAAIGVMLGRSW